MRAMSWPGRIRPAVAVLALACAGATASPPAAQTAVGTGLITVDSHVDIPDAYMREPRFDAGGHSVLQVDLDKMERGGLDAAFFVVYVEQGALDAAGYAKAVAAADNKFDAIAMMVARNPQRIRLATSPAQVRQNHAEGKLSALIGPPETAENVAPTNHASLI